jgi:hypothetical protein
MCLNFITSKSIINSIVKVHYRRPLSHLNPVGILTLCFSNILFNIIVPSVSRSHELSFLFRFSDTLLYAFFISPKHGSRSAHLVLLTLLTYIHTYIHTCIHTPWCRTIFVKLIVTQVVKKYPAFCMEPEGSLPSSQKPTVGPRLPWLKCPDNTGWLQMMWRLHKLNCKNRSHHF